MGIKGVTPLALLSFWLPGEGTNRRLPELGYHPRADRSQEEPPDSSALQPRKPEPQSRTEGLLKIPSTSLPNPRLIPFVLLTNDVFIKATFMGALEAKISHERQINLVIAPFPPSFQEGEAVLGDSLLLPSQMQIQMHTCLTALTNQFLTD